MRTFLCGWLCLTALLTIGCGDMPSSVSQTSFALLSGSENKDLEPIFQRYAAQQQVALTVSYLGSVEMELQLQSGKVDADAVLPASSIWLQVGDTHRIVKDAKSVMRSPVVLGVSMPIAKELGWDRRADVTFDDILAQMENGRIRSAMTSASQSNSGAMAFLGILSAFAGHPDVLTNANVSDPAVQDKARRLFASVHRSSGSSGFLKDLYLKDPTAFDAMFNYESMVIQADRDLALQGRDPLCAVYPVDGLEVADYPLGFIDHGDAAKVAFFHGLQDFLLTPATQKEIETYGRRPGDAILAEKLDASVFRADWCVDADRVLSPLPLPTAQVIGDALDAYQTALRKPSRTEYVLDLSGSMSGDRLTQLKSAMRTVIDPTESRRNRLQASTRDVTEVFIFSDVTEKVGEVDGNDAAQLRALGVAVQGLEVGGGTMLHRAVADALEAQRQFQLQHPDRDDPLHVSHYLPSIIVMTDGEGRDDPRILTEYRSAHPEMSDTPIYAIQFGEAKKEQLEAIAGKDNVFNGTTDLGKAMREARGYN